MNGMTNKPLTFLDQAKLGKNNWWIYLVVPILMVAGNIIGSMPLLGITLLKTIQGGDAQRDALAKTGDLSSLGLDTNLSLFLMLLTFAGTLVGLWFGVKFLHKRAFSTLIYSQAIRWNRVAYAAGLWFLTTILMELLNYAIHPEGYEWVFQPVPFGIGFVISIVMIPIQTSFEELCFRGWLMQGIGSLSVIRAVPLLITGALFGLMHLANPEVAHYGFAQMMVYYIGFGIFMGLITLLSDGLELSLGIHAANNFYGATMISFSSSALQTNTLFRSPDPDVTLMLVGSTVFMVGVYFILNKKFGFAPINSLLEKQAD